MNYNNVLLIRGYELDRDQLIFFLQNIGKVEKYCALRKINKFNQESCSLIEFIFLANYIYCNRSIVMI